MTIEQAKEIFNIFLQDIEMNEDGNYILELRLNPDDTWSHFTPEDIKAFKMAFSSLEVLEKVVKELKDVEEICLGKNCAKCEILFCTPTFALEVIDKYEKEIEE